MAGVRAPITPEVMEWVRKKSGYSIEDAAGRIGRSPQDLKLWETGELKPPIAQLRKASKVYKRPLAVFFLPAPPRDFAPLKDFRKLPKGVAEEYSPELAFVIRRIQSRQQWLSEFLESENYTPVSFVGSGSLKEEPVSLAEKIRNSISIGTKESMACRGREELLRLWKEHVEGNGIFVCQAGNLRWEKVSVQEARGFLLIDRYAPFIFLNAQDAKAAQLFTLAHELVHLWINEPGISNRAPIVKPRSDSEEIEVFCNKVAAEILVPKKRFKALWDTRNKDKSLEENIRHFSNHFKVSTEVVARKLLDLGVISNGSYKNLVEKFNEEWKLYKQKSKKPEKVDFHLVKLSNNGRAFTKVVLGAYEGGALSGSDTAGLLEIKINHLPKIAEFVGLPVGSVRKYE